MANKPGPAVLHSARTLHWLGVSCGFGAGAWLGAAEASFTKRLISSFDDLNNIGRNV